MHAGRKTADRVDLLVCVLPLARQTLDRLHRPGLDRGETVQLELLADHVQEVLLDDAFAGPTLGEATDRADFAHEANPCRYGLVARSRFIVVAGPCPGSTSTSSARGRITSRRLRFMASPSPPARSVRPIEPANSTSPDSTVDRAPASAAIPTGTSGSAKITEPSVWPGACSTTRSRPAIVSSWP